MDPAHAESAEGERHVAHVAARTLAPSPPSLRTEPGPLFSKRAYACRF